MSKGRIGVQLWSVREDCAKNLEATLEGVAKMGYEGVELAGLYNRNAAQWVKLLKDNGLVAKSAHVGLGDLMPEKIQATMNLYGEIGAKNLCVGWLGNDYMKDLDGYRRGAEVFNQAAAAGAKAGFRFGYHNHDIEFKPMDGIMPMEAMAKVMGPTTILELDLGWVCHAGADPVAFLKKFPGRSQFVHVKAHSATNKTAVLGEDDVDWPRVLRACVDIGATEWLVVEHEEYANPPMVCIKQCIDYMKKISW